VVIRQAAEAKLFKKKRKPSAPWVSQVRAVVDRASGLDRVTLVARRGCERETKRQRVQCWRDGEIEGEGGVESGVMGDGR